MTAIEHTIWRLDDDAEIAAISEAVGRSPVVIADGHHRYETSLAYRDERRADEGAGGPADATMMLVVELVDDELTVRPIHRLVSGLPSGTDLAVALESRGFSPAGSATAAEVADGQVLAAMNEADAIAVVRSDGSATLLHPDPAAFGGVPDLDSARVAQALAGLPAHDVVYQHGTDLVQAAVAAGAADAGLLLRPATVRPDRRQRPHRRAHAGQDDVLPSEAQDRHRVPPHADADVDLSGPAEHSGARPPVRAGSVHACSAHEPVRRTRRRSEGTLGAVPASWVGAGHDRGRRLRRPPQ